MRRLAFVPVLMLLLALTAVAPAYAQDQCRVGAFTQYDMAGTYLSIEHQIRVTMFPCGGTHLLWSNQLGTHEAAYYGETRLTGGGIITRVASPDPIVRSLDNRNVMALKPAEPGWIQIITIGPFGEDFRTYRLRKVS